MKFLTTPKAIKQGCPLVIRCGYGAVQHLFHGVDPIAYTRGTYGWNADIYIKGGTAIVTGYRTFGDSRYEDIIKGFDDAAHRVLDNIEDISQLKQNDKLEDLRREFYKAIWERMRKLNDN